MQEEVGQAVSVTEGVALLQVSMATARGCEGSARVVEGSSSLVYVVLGVLP